MTIEKKSIFEKLQKSRTELSSKPLKKGGKNKYAGYEYFELTDFLSESDRILNDNRLTPVFNYIDNVATLTLYDWDNGTPLVFRTNDADATTLNKSGQPSNLEIQTLGSKHTYLKRYLYMHLMNIAENDGLESNTGNEEHKPKNMQLISFDQITDIKLLYGKRVEGMLKHYELERLEDMTSIMAKQLIDIEKKNQDKIIKQEEPVETEIIDVETSEKQVSLSDL